MRINHLGNVASMVDQLEEKMKSFPDPQINLDVQNAGAIAELGVFAKKQKRL
jgi:hypothetical protein